VPRAPDKPIRGAIVSVDGGVSEFGQFQIVSLNRGSRDGLQVGHVLASYHRGEVVDTTGRTRGYVETTKSGPGIVIRPNPVVPDPPNAPAQPTDTKVGVVAVGTTLKLPDERNGLVFVFRVFDRISYALVMHITRPVNVKDVVQNP